VLISSHETVYQQIYGVMVVVLDSGLLGTICEASWWHKLFEVTQGIWQR